jgi:hypothetical protein
VPLQSICLGKVVSTTDIEPTDGFYRFVTAKAVFGVEVRNGRVVEAAPYAQAQGSRAHSVFQRWQKRGAQIERIVD